MIIVIFLGRRRRRRAPHGEADGCAGDLHTRICIVIVIYVIVMLSLLYTQV